MAQQRQIMYSIDFEVNKKKIEQLKKSLQDIQKMTIADVSAGKIDNNNFKKMQEQLRDAQSAARVTEQALTKAFNPKLNTTNIEKFKKELSASGLNMDTLRKKMQSVGPTGARAFSQLETSVYKMGQTVKQSHTVIDKMYTTFTNSIKWGLSSAIINGFTRTLEQAWGYVKSLDTSLNDIRIVTGKSAEEMERFAEKANQVAQNLGKSTTDYTKAALIYAQQGLNDKEIEARTEATLKTANVTGQSAEQISNQLTAVWNGYKVSAEEAEVYVDRLAAVAATTASNLQELSTGMSKVASAAFAMGVGEDQLAAQLSTIISVTKQAPQSVGTALRTVYARITDIKAGIDEDGVTLGQYSGKMAEMGINVLDVSGNLRDMGTVMEEIGNKWGTMTREQQIYLAQTMAGQRQYNNLLALFDNFDKYNSALKTAQDATGTLQEQQDTYMQSANAQLNQLRTATENIYDSLLDPKKITPLLEVFTKLANAVATFVDGLGGGAGVLNLLGTIGLNVFGDKIANSLQATISNASLAKAEMAELGDKIQNLQALQNDPKANDYTKEWAAIQEDLLTKQKDLNGLIPNDVLQKAEELNAHIKDLKAQLAEIDDKKSALSGKIDELAIKNNLTVQQTVNQETGQLEIPSGLQAYMNPADNFSQNVDTILSEELEKVQKFQSTLSVSVQNFRSSLLQGSGDAIKSIEDEITKVTQAFNQKTAKEGASDQDIKKFQEEIDKLNKKLEQTKNVSETAFNKIKTQVEETVQALQENKTGLVSEDEIKKLQTFQDTLKNIKPEELQEKFPEISQTLAQFAGVLNLTKDQITQFQEELKHTPEAGNDIPNAIAEYQEAFNKLKESMDGAVLAKGLTDALGGIASLTTGINQLSNAGKAIGELATKGFNLKSLGKVTSSAAAGVGSLINGYKKLNSTLKTVKSIMKMAENATKAKKAAIQQDKVATDADTNAQRKQNAENRRAGGAAGQAAGGIKGKTAAEETDTVVTQGATRATTAFGAALNAVLGPIGWVMLAITTLTTAYSIYQGAVEAQSQAEKQSLQTKKELAQENEQALNSELEFYNAVEELYKQYEQGEITRTELMSSIEQLGKQYEIEGEKLATLKNSYQDFYDTVNRLRNSTAISGEIEADTAAQAAENLIDTSKLDEYAKMGHEMGGSSGYVKQEKVYDAKTVKALEDAGYRRVNEADITRAGQTRAKEDYFTHAGLGFIGLASPGGVPGVGANIAFALENQNYKNKRNQASVEYQGAMVRSFDVNNKADLVKQYGKTLQNIQTFTELGLDNSIIETEKKYLADLTSSEVKQAYQEYSNKLDYKQQQLTISAKQDLNTVSSIDDYAKIKESMLKQITDKYGEYFSEEELQSRVNKILSSANSESFNKFNGLTEMAQKNKLTISEMPKEIANLYSELDEAQITELLSLDPTLLKSWDSIKDNIVAISKTKIPPLFSDAEIDAAATKFQQIEDVINKVSSGKSIGVKDFKELDISDEIKKKYFRQGLNGFEMVGDRRAFEEDMQKEQAKVFAQLEQGSLYRYGVYNQRQDFVSKNSNLIKQIRETRDKYNPDDYVDNDYEDNQEFTSLSKNMIKILKETDFGQTPEGQQQLQQFEEELQKGLTKELFASILNQYDERVEDADFDLSALDKKIQEEKENAKQAGDLIYDSLFPKDVDIKDNDLYNLQQVIQDTSTASNELSSNLNFNARTAKALSEEILRFNDGLMDAAKNISSWKEELNSGALTSVTAIRDAYSDMLNLDGQGLSEEFLRSTNNLDLMNIALTGTDEQAKQAFNTLKALAQQDILFSVGISLEEYQENTEQLRQIVENAQIGQTLKDELIQPFFDMLVQAGMTASQIKDIFEGMDIRLQISQDEDGKLTYQKGTASKTGDTDFLWKNRSKQLEKEAKNLKKQQQAQVDLKKVIQDQRDLYHDINIELDEINRKLKNAQKEQKKLYGKDLIEGLNKQEKIIKQEIKALKQKQAIQKADKQNQQRELASKGITFDSNGRISNYLSLMTSAQNKVDSLTNNYNTLANQYNASRDITEKENLKQQMDKVNKDLTAANNELSDLKTGINNYDKLLKDMGSVEDQIQEEIDALVESNVEKFNLKAKLTLELGQAQRQWNEFKRNVLERDSVIYTNAFIETNKNASQNLVNAESYYTSGEISANTEKLNRAMTSAKNIRRYGKDELYGDNIALAMKDAKQASEQLQKQLKAVGDQLSAVDQTYLDTIDNVQQMYTKQKQAYQKYGEQLSHDLDLIKLVYGQKNYKEMNRYYDKLQKNNINQLDFLKKINTENYKQWQEAERRAEQYARQHGMDSELTKEAAEDAKRFKEAYLNGVSEINSTITASIQNLQEQYSNAINQIFDNMQKALANGKSFEYMDTQWDLMKKKANLYLDTVNSAFAIKNTEYLYSQALNDVKGLKSQQQLKKVMNEQLEILKQKDKLTQYDVDRAQKVLEVEKARIALEQSRNNKTQMRLKRDSQGNYSYQYVADQDNIAEAENNLAKAQNDLYNFDKTQYEKNLEEAYNAAKEMQTKLSELAEEYRNNYDNPEKQAEILKEMQMVRKQYVDYIQGLSQGSIDAQMNMVDSAKESYISSLQDGKEKFLNMTTEQMLAWLGDEGLVPSINSGIQEMINKFVSDPESFSNLVKGAIGDIINKNTDYENKLQELQDAAGINLTEIKNGYGAIAVAIGGEDGQGGLIKNNDDLIDKMDDEYDKMEELRGKGQELRGKYKEITDQAILAVEQFQQMWAEQQKQAIQATAGAVNQVADAYATLTANLKDYQRQQTDGGTGTGGGTGTSEGDTTKLDKEKEKERNLYKGNNEIEQQAIRRYEYRTGSSVTKQIWEKNKKNIMSQAFTDQQKVQLALNGKLKTWEEWNNYTSHSLKTASEWDRMIRNSCNFNGMPKMGALTIADFNKVLSKNKYTEATIKDIFKKYQQYLGTQGGKYIKFDSGGYTGDWDSSEGRIAILHEKELVLNKQDTANLLDTIQALRDIYTMNTIQSQITSMLESLNEQAKVQKERIETLKQQKSLQQQVSISASFPSVTNKNEIEAAFNELINKATQATLKNKK